MAAPLQTPTASAATVLSFSDAPVLLVAPCPLGKGVVEGWMSRIRAVDEIFLGMNRVYLNFVSGADGTTDPRSETYPGRVVEYHVNAQSESHRRLIEKLLMECRICYVHTVHLARFMLGYFPTGKIVTDFHGVVPEEEAMLGDPEASLFYEAVETTVIHNSAVIVVVTQAMQNHLKKKYPDCTAKFVVLPIIEDHEVNWAQRHLMQPGRPCVLYSGGSQAWQNVGLMLDICRRANVDARYLILSHDQQRISKMALDAGVEQNIYITQCNRKDLAGYYLQAHLGFVLRDDVIVNKVACPTKLSEYMQFGIVPIVKSPEIGDFKSEGYQYITYTEYEVGLLPSRDQLNDMAHHNLAVLNRIRGRFESGAETLQKLVLRSRVSANNFVGLPVGERPGTFPSKRELYVFGEAQTYHSQTLIGLYDRASFNLAEVARGDLVRVVPFLLDFALRGMRLKVRVREAGVRPLIVQSRARRVGNVDFFRSEAPFIEIKFDRITSLTEVCWELDLVGIGPGIWKAAVVGNQPNWDRGHLVIDIEAGSVQHSYTCDVQYIE